MKELSNNLSVRHKGFSLLEMSLVVVLLAVLTAMAVPRFAGSANNYRVSLAARKVAADLGRARADAWSRGVHRTVTFNTAALQYTLTGVADMNNSALADTVVSLNTSPYNLTQMSTNFAPANAMGLPLVIFDGYGMPNSGGTVTVTSGTLSQTVTVNATTGNITIP
jgi:prepilin-type N-terminal cleavage/methylation domain-containing protein